MIILLCILFALSCLVNLYLLLRVRKHRAGLKYVKYEFDRFSEETEQRIMRQQELIAELRDEIKRLDPENVVNLSVLAGGEK